MPGIPRAACVLLALALLLAACGARLTEEQRGLALAGASDHGGQSHAAGAGDPSARDGGTVEIQSQPSDELTDAPQAVGDGEAPDTGERDGGVTAVGERSEEDGPADATSPVDVEGGDQDAGNGGLPADTRAMPEGGNGGATDVGVTEDRIVLSNVSDVSGAVPGLFEPSQLAAQAYVEFFTQTEGTLFGRSLEFLPFDSQMNAGANRAASMEACDRSFAGIGSMSAFDQGGAPVIAECGIPDIRTLRGTQAMQQADNAYATQASRADRASLGSYEWVATAHPNVTDKAAYLYIGTEITEESTRRTRELTSEQLGWDWIYVQDIDIAETNYAPFVLEMRDRGVEYVTFQGAYQQAVRLAEAMQQQGFEPEVYHLQSNTYTPETIELGGSAVEGVYVSINSVMLEEIDQHPELQRYAAALQQIAPGETPDGLATYSWSAAKLFVDIAKRLGPGLTREAMLAELAEVEGWDGGGLHPPQDIGSREPSPCFLIVQVQDGEFTRAHPSEGFDCSGDIVDVPM